MGVLLVHYKRLSVHSALQNTFLLLTQQQLIFGLEATYM